MVFLFSLINISFTTFFFLFWKYLESGFFWVITIIFILYFSKILSIFTEKKKITQEKNLEENLQKFPIKSLIRYFKKWSYYIAFLLFYLSLYGFIYGLNLLYNFSDFSEIFHFITLSISLIISGIFFFFQQKNNETIFRLFRSNCIIFTTIYSFLILFSLFKDISPNTLFTINSVFPLFTLITVLLFDTFFKEKIKYIYIFFLFYIFLISFYYTSVIFPLLPIYQVFLGVLSFFMVLFVFFFPFIRYFSSFLSLFLWLF